MILFLLRAGERSHWHRIDATEIWHHHAGGPLRMSTSSVAGHVDESVIGDAAAGHAPTAIVPPHVWQAAEPVEGWALVACTVTPGFEFDGFELAPAGWTP